GGGSMRIVPHAATDAVAPTAIDTRAAPLASSWPRGPEFLGESTRHGTSHGGELAPGCPSHPGRLAGHPVEPPPLPGRPPAAGRGRALGGPAEFADLAGGAALSQPGLPPARARRGPLCPDPPRDAGARQLDRADPPGGALPRQAAAVLLAGDGE